jgi:membrane associated rhomboid family serine protease
MIPISDDNRDRTITPYVNYILIGLNILVFILFQGAGNNLNFTYAFATVPAEIISGEDLVTPDQVYNDPASGQPFALPGLQPTPISVYITLFTAMFMHGGWAHLLGNMLYLWIFGDNLEDRMGHGRYLLFYLATGVLASLAHVFASVLFGDNLQIPSLGASGAIAGVLGGYLVLFPRRRVTVLVLRIVTQVNAFIAVGLWFVYQLVGGLGTISGSSDGVAYAAHIGGFIAGVVLIKLFTVGREPAARLYY